MLFEPLLRAETSPDLSAQPDSLAGDSISSNPFLTLLCTLGVWGRRRLFEAESIWSRLVWDLSSPACWSYPACSAQPHPDPCSTFKMPSFLNIPVSEGQEASFLPYRQVDPRLQAVG